jgi:hypothetical protein
MNYGKSTCGAVTTSPTCATAERFHKLQVASHVTCCLLHPSLRPASVLVSIKLSKTTELGDERLQ